MLSSFKLPDLVLGVSIKADTAGAREAARQLRTAVQSEMNKLTPVGGGGGGGTGGGGGGRGGGSATALAAMGIGSQVGSQISQITSQAGVNYHQILENINRNFPYNPVERQREQALLDQFAAGLNQAERQREKQKVGRAQRASLTPTYNPRSGLQGYGGVPMPAPIDVAKSIKAGARAAAPAVTKATAAAVKNGSIKGFVSSASYMRGVWGLVITGIIVGAFRTAIAAMAPSLSYIRTTGTQEGRYGDFSTNLSQIEVLLKNVGIQFGLMVIDLYELDKAMSDIIPVLVQIANLFEWMGKQEWIKTIIKLNELSQVNFQIAKWGLGFFAKGANEGTGGVDLGQGMAMSKLAGAAMEGSVAAYRTIQGTMMKYASETAKNTKEAAGALKKILDRAPEMGVVMG